MRYCTPALVVGIVMIAACRSTESESGVPESKLIASTGRPTTPDVSPDGKRIAWAAAAGSKFVIFTANTDGSNAVQLTHGEFEFGPIWSPDGKFIAFSGGNDDIFVVPSGGGETRRLTSTPAQDQVREWLPDGSGVIFYRSGAGPVRTFVAKLDGSPPTPLVPAADGDQWVSVSPDGKLAAFDLHHGSASTIWVQSLAGGPARQLTTEGLESALPTQNMWSPDSKRILFVSRRTGTWDIWVADVETGQLTQITSDLRNDIQHRWSPDGRWIAFSSDRGGQTDVWIAPSTGGPAMRVTNDPAIESWIRWSRDGQTLFFHTQNAAAGLDLLSLDTGTRRNLLSWPSYSTDGVDLSPDGRTAVFTSNRSGNPDIWTVPTAGGEPVPLATGPGDDVMPRYSPDGKWIVFQSNRSGSEDIWLQSVSGGEPVQLTSLISREIDPVWSPDGSMIAFLSSFENSAVSRLDLWVVDAKGGNPRRLSKLAGAAKSAVWAPDGKHIYFAAAEASGSERLYRVAPNGTNPVVLDQSPAGRYYGLDISPDGKEVAYAIGGEWAYIQVIPAAGGKPRLVSTDTTGIWQFEPRWLPDGSGLVVNSADIVFTNSEVWSVSWPQRVWKRLTNSKDIDEYSTTIFPNGKEIILQTGKAVNEIKSVSVSTLVAGK
ncbi:MAG: DPP IV N-terminal domain-containing protein [Gemmatimonadaceae bacterium]